MRYVGATSLFASGLIHVYLFLTRYWTAPTMSELFLLQGVAALVLGTAVERLRRRVIDVAGAGLLMTTLLGYLVALRRVIFGFGEVRSTMGIVAGAVEIVGFAALGMLVFRPVDQRRHLVSPSAPRRGIVSLRATLLAGRWAIVVLAVQSACTFALLQPTADAKSANVMTPSITLQLADVRQIEVPSNT